MKTQTSKRPPAIPVYVFDLKTMFPSANQAAAALLANSVGGELRQKSVSGRISTAIKNGGGRVLGFTVVRNPAPEMSDDDDDDDNEE